MKLYSLLYSFFDCLSCKTLPNDFDPIYGYDTDEEEPEEIKQWPYQFFMVTRY
jgi:hypothetical protein